MKKTNAFFYLLFAIIIIAILSFLFLEKADKLKFNFLIQSETNSHIVNDYGLIYEEISKNKQLKMSQFDFEIHHYKNFLEFKNHVKSAVQERTSNVVFCHFENKKTYDNFLKMNDYLSPLYITFYQEEIQKKNQPKEILCLLPPPNTFAHAINELFELNNNHQLLMITNPKNNIQISNFQFYLNGQVTTVTIDSNNETFENSIYRIGNILSTVKPDYIFIDLNEKTTITLLEKIVGFPREKIILMPENTSVKVGYYTGSNAYGINGITFMNPNQIEDFDNKNSLLKMIAQAITDCFISNKKTSIAELKKYLEVNSNTTFGILNNSVITPIYRIKYTEKGLRVIDKVDITK